MQQHTAEHPTQPHLPAGADASHATAAGVRAAGARLARLRCHGHRIRCDTRYASRSRRFRLSCAPALPGRLPHRLPRSFSLGCLNPLCIRSLPCCGTRLRWHIVSRGRVSRLGRLQGLCWCLCSGRMRCLSGRTSELCLQVVQQRLRGRALTALVPATLPHQMEAGRCVWNCWRTESICFIFCKLTVAGIQQASRGPRASTACLGMAA